MVKDLEKLVTATIKNNVMHQGIGGKTIVIEKETTYDYFTTKNFDDMTISEINFIMRRTDLLALSEKEEERVKVYYGHVGMLGYWICEDEIENILEGEL